MYADMQILLAGEIVFSLVMCWDFFSSIANIIDGFFVTEIIECASSTSRQTLNVHLLLQL